MECTILLASNNTKGRGHTHERCCQVAATTNQKLRNTYFVDMIQDVLRDLAFSRNRSLKLAEDWYIRILKNKIKSYVLHEIRKKYNMITLCDLN
jgi:hypothetical protein